MTKVDFGIAFFMLVVSIIYAVSFISSNLTNDFNHFNSEKVENAASVIEGKMFGIRDGKSLVSEFKQIQVKFDEVGMVPHTSSLDVKIEPQISKIHVYNKTFSEISSSVSFSSSHTNVSFDLDFLAGEEKYVYLIYEGGNTTNIEYTSNVSDTNVTSFIVSEKELYLLSQDKCNWLKTLSFQQSKEMFGFTENFRITNECVYGPIPPSNANIIVKTIPMVVEESDSSLKMEKIKLMVW